MKRFLVLLVIFYLFACSGRDDEWVVKVGEQRLLTQRVTNSFAQSQEFQKFGNFTPLQIKRFIETNYVPDLLVVQEAVNRGLESDSLIQFILEEEKKELLAKPNGPLYRLIVPDTFEVKEEEIKEYYQYLKKEIQVAHILVDSKSLADMIYTKIQNGASFSQMARKYSTDRRNADQGGALEDYLYWDYERTRLDTVAFSLEPGEVSPPVRSNVGFHIIKLLNVRARSPEPLDLVRPAIRSSIAFEKRQQFISHYIKELFVKYDLVVNPELQPNLLEWMQGLQQDKITLDTVDQAALKKTAVSFAGGSWTVGELLEKFESIDHASIPMHEKQDLVLFVQRALAHEFMAKEAIAKGLDQDNQFLADLASRRIDLFVQVALDRWVYDSITVNEDEIMALYEERKNQLDRSLEEMRPILVNQIKMKKANEKREQWIKQLKDNIDIQYNDSALEQIAASVSAIKTAA